jgi:hypothetical protein
VVPLSCGVWVYLPDDLDLKIVRALEEESRTREQQDSANAPHAPWLSGIVVNRGF